MELNLLIIQLIKKFILCRAVCYINMLEEEAINCIQSLIYRENDAKLSCIDDKKYGTLENVIEEH